MALDFEYVESLVTSVPEVVPQPVQVVISVLFLAGWGYAILHFLRNEMSVKLKILWGLIVFVVPFGFMFYLTSHVEWEERGYKI